MTDARRPYFCTMEQEIIVTEDGSKTIYLPHLDETYHSSHGAIQEALHVFIMNGLEGVEGDEITIFEMGFGTGLNALLAYRFAKQTGKRVVYHGIEAFPVALDVAKEMDYISKLEADLNTVFEWMHSVEWDAELQFDELFTFKKVHAKIEDYDVEVAKYDVIFYDAFGPRAQSDMWAPSILEKMYNGTKENKFLVTYCAKGQVKRDLKALGYTIEALPGPPGKREMTRAWKRP